METPKTGSFVVHDIKVVVGQQGPYLRFGLLVNDAEGNPLLDVRGFMYSPDKGVIPPLATISGQWRKYYKIIDLYPFLEEALTQVLSETKLAKEIWGEQGRAEEAAADH